jgi:C1A family cysteine protease
MLKLFVFGLLSLFNPAETFAYVQEEFSNFVHQHQKVYTSDLEYNYRKSIFNKNLDYINHHNSLNKSYTLGINKFADLTTEEFKARFTPLKNDNYKCWAINNDAKNCIQTQGCQWCDKDPIYGTFCAPLGDSNCFYNSVQENTTVTLPTSLDWRVASQNPKNLVAVTPVKDQKNCGSCYAHAAAESTESAMAISGYPLVELSPQQIVDCSDVPPYNNAGCGGGDPSETFQYIIDKGLCKASDYPYKAVQGSCHSCTPVGHLKGYVNIPTENGIYTELQKGPVNIAIEADSAAFQFYSSGVFDDSSCGTTLDHAVNLVGYGTDSSSGKPYFILRNSWSSGWGINGYMKIVAGKNMCGLSQMAQRGYYMNQLSNLEFNWNLLWDCLDHCGANVIKDIIECSGDLAHIWDILKCVGDIVGTVSPCYKCIKGILN